MASPSVSAEIQRPQFPDALRELITDLLELRALRRGDPFQTESLLFNAELLEEAGEKPMPPEGLIIALLIMAIAEVTAEIRTRPPRERP
jgi:hypothetical protein